MIKCLKFIAELLKYVPVSYFLGHLTNGWTVQVGAHSDNLTKLHQPLRRWPQLMVKTEIKQRETRLYSPYGGLIYLESPQVCFCNILYIGVIWL